MTMRCAVAILSAVQEVGAQLHCPQCGEGLGYGKVHASPSPALAAEWAAKTVSDNRAAGVT